MFNPARKVTVREDDKGIYVKYKTVYTDEYLIIRPGVAECWGGQKNVFKAGDKVKVTKLNSGMGFFMLRKPDNSDGETWQGPRYETVGAVKEWVGEKV